MSKIVLNEILGLDTLPIQVLPDHTIVANVTTERAPENGSYGEDYEEAITNGVNGWKAISGLSNQYAYEGIIMHASEFIGEELEQVIMNKPGYYAVEAIYSTDEDNEDEIAGWVLLHKEN